MGLEEGDGVGEGHRLQVGAVADHGVRVGEVAGVGQLVDAQEGGDVGLVVVVLLALLDDGVALVLEVGRGEVQVGHAVGLEPQGQLEGVAGDGLPVFGVVGSGRAVADPARLGDDGEVLHLADVRRALEHHVLEEVGEAGSSRRLDGGADVVMDGDGDGGDQVVGGDDDAEAVVEGPGGDGEVQGGGRRDGRQDGEGQEQGGRDSGHVGPPSAKTPTRAKRSLQLARRPSYSPRALAVGPIAQTVRAPGS